MAERILQNGDTTDFSPGMANSIQARRSRGHGTVLTLPALPRSFTIPRHPSREETMAEGETLFRSFLYEEIQREEEEIPSFQTFINSLSTGDQVPPSPLMRNPTPRGNTAIAQMAQELLTIADDFRVSSERKRVLDQANRVPELIQREAFLQILETMFEGGITRERFIVVFFFCRDVALRALKRHAVEYFRRFFMWSLEFIKDRVCAWVLANGGWGRVLSHSLDYAYKIVKGSFMLVVFGAACIYIYKSMKSG